MKTTRKLDYHKHNEAPLFEALKKHIDENIIPFHVPGHKYGKGNPELLEFMGKNTLAMDVNAMRDLDDLCNPISVIKEAQALTADAFGADQAFFLTNGTTAGIHAMMLSTIAPGETIILPRNCHKSAYTGLILSGAIPAYASVSMNKELGITTCLSIKAVEEAIKKAPQALAIMVINPSYYGFTSDLKSIVNIAHENNTTVIVDEAHGCHMGFHPEFPMTAMESGADLSASSTHKTGGSLTQSSYLLSRGHRVGLDLLTESIDLIRTTSSSYLLMASLDLARKQLAIKGEKKLDAVIGLAREARKEINEIEGLYAFGKDLIEESTGIYAFDETKLGVCVRKLGMSGFDLDKMLRNKYDIQLELEDMNNILALISIGDDERSVRHLVEALKDIALNTNIKDFTDTLSPPDFPTVVISPRDAFYSPKRFVNLKDAAKEICGEMVMAYPPGIPLLCPGEKVNQDTIDYIASLKEKNCQFQGPVDPKVEKIRVLGD